MEHGFLAGLSVFALLGALFALFIAGLILALSAKLVGIENASVLGAIVAIVGGGILGGIVGAIVALLFFWITPLNAVLAGLAFVITYVWVIKAVFNTSWLRAFVAWIIAMIIEGLIIGLLGALGVATMAHL